MTARIDGVSNRTSSRGARCLPPWMALVLAGALGCGAKVDPNQVHLSGRVEATDVKVATQVPGRILARPVEEGTVVQVGDVIAVIDTTDARLALAAAEADRDQADAALRLLEAGARREEVDEAEANFAQARAEQDVAEKDYARAKLLVESGTSTPKREEDATARRDATRAVTEAARQRVLRLRAGARPEERLGARARLDAATARVAQIEQQLRDATVRSTRRGVITETLAEAGEMVTAGSPLVVLTDLGNPWMVGYVAEPDLGKVRLGAEAEVVTDGGERRRGRVTYVASTAEFTPKNVQTRDERVKMVFEVKIGLENEDGLFKPGMPIEATLHGVRGGGQ